MGKNYYLSKGNLNVNFKDVQLTEIFSDMKSLESIDMWTSKFNNLDELKREILSRGLIRSNEDICIATYKTDKTTKVKKLVPIYHRRLVFKSDFERLGIIGKSYEGLVYEVRDYIRTRFNDLDFMTYIIDNYYEKYAPKDEDDINKKKVPIYESGDISILHRIIHSKEKTARDEKEYAVSLKNFINNELFKCERVYEDVVFSGNYSESVKIFKPKKGEINVKGLHDLLCCVIDYGQQKVVEYNVSEQKEIYVGEQITLEDYDNEEFLEDRDFERPLNEYAKEVGLNLDDQEALEKDDYANSFVLDQHRLVKKRDGME